MSTSRLSQRRRSVKQTRTTKTRMVLELLEDRTVLSSDPWLGSPFTTPLGPQAGPPTLIPPPGHGSGGGLTGPGGNVLVNNPALDTTAQDTQSETTVIAFGSTVLVGYNDSGSYIGGTQKFTGWSRSTDGGATFTDRGTLPSEPNGDLGDPVLARDNTSGTVYFATLSASPRLTRIQVSRSFDGGATFQTPVNAVPGRPAPYLDKEWITVDNFAGAGQGNVYLVVREFGSGPGIYFTRSTDQGATWGPNGGLLISSASNQGAFVAVGPDHAVYAFWFEQTSPQRIMMRKSTDQGLTFGTPVVVTTLSTTGTNGDLGLTGIRMGTSTPAGFRSNAFPHATVNPVTGEVYVVYNDNPPGADKADAMFIQSANGGATWSAPVKVNDDATTTDQFFPTIAVTPNGSKVGIFWYDRRNDAANNLIDRYAVIGNVSTTTVTFQPNFRVTDVSFPPEFGRDPVVNATYMGDYDTVSADNNFFYTVWGDNRDNSVAVPTRKTANVRFAKIAVEVAGPSVIATTPSGNVAAPVSSLRLTFNEAIDLATFTTADIVSFTGPSGPITVTGLNVVAGSGDTRFDVTFAPQAATGRYTIVLGPNVLDTSGRLMDQNGNLIPGEDPADRFTGSFGILGPRITAGSPTGSQAGPVSSVRVTFGMAMDPTTFAANDVTLTGPAGAVAVTGVTPVAGSGNTQFDIAFAPQGPAGTYTMVVGPNVRDLFGNSMDQNNNLIPGEIPGDQYTHTFSVFPPRVTASTPTGSQAGPVSSVRVTFNKAMGPPSFTPTDVTFTGPGGATITVTGVTPVTGSGNTQFDISFAPQGPNGNYSMVIGPDVRDVFGNQMDQNNNGILGEIPGDRFTTTFSIFAPRITSSTPVGSVVDPVSNVRVVFNKSMNPATFVPGDVTFTGPGGTITVTAITPVAGTSNTQFDVGFAPLTAAGTYTIVVGPDVRDVSGNQMDQNNNGITGEIPGDRYTTTFRILAPRVTSSTPTGSLSGPVTSVRVFFSEGMNPTTFTAADVTFTAPGGGSIPISAITPVAGSSNTQFDLTFAPQGPAGTYRMVIGPDVRDVGGNPMDQNNNGIPGEIPGDQYTHTFSVFAPRALSSSPTGITLAPVSNVRVTFNKAMDAAAFTPVDIVSFNGPGGAITVTGITPVSGSTTQFDILFAPQNAEGVYTIVLGPDVRDTLGNPMDQNNNGILGEIPGDRFTATFTIGIFGPDGFGYMGRANPYESIGLVPGAADVFVIIDGVDDSFGAVNLGTNTFNFYGTAYTGVNQLFVSTNGLITFGSGYTSHINTDLTTAPATRAIAVLWDDWLTNVNTNDQVLGKLDDTDGDGTPDRLIIEWHQVYHISSDRTNPATFQAVLQLNTGSTAGSVLLNYPDLVVGNVALDNGSSATVGIKDTGTQGSRRILVSFNNGATPFLRDGRTVRFGVRHDQTVNGTDVADTIVLRNHATYPNFAEVLINGTVRHSGPWAELSGLTLNGLAGNDTFTIEAIAAGVPVTVDGGLGDDTFDVGDAGQTLNRIQGALTVEGGSDTNALTLHDQGDSAGQAYYLTSSTVDRFTAAPISYSNVQGLSLYAGSGDDYLQLSDTAAGTPVAFDGGSGNNSVQGPDAATVWGITALDAGYLYGDVIGGFTTFASVQNLIGGAADDVYIFDDGQGVGGYLYDLGGSDTLYYGYYTTDVYVSLDVYLATGVAWVYGPEHVYGGAGNDLLRGDAGDNLLVGGDGDDILLGYEGNDYLEGGSGRNILIGGLGSDGLFGGTGEDLLFDGVTAYDGDDSSLTFLRAEWARTDLAYDARVEALRAYLDATTVYSDGEYDELYGQEGLDWFWADLFDATDRDPLLEFLN